jgi:hypothetical protein
VNTEATPIPMILTCPSCSARHIDTGIFETKVHHTHACQSCGMVWRPAIGPTVGVQFLPGFSDPDPKTKTAIASPAAGSIAELAQAILARGYKLNLDVEVDGRFIAELTKTHARRAIAYGFGPRDAMVAALDAMESGMQDDPSFLLEGALALQRDLMPKLDADAFYAECARRAKDKVK